MCQVFGVSRSGYYNWVQHEPSDRKQSDERLKQEIKVAHIRTRETYGTRRLQTELAENGIIVGRDRLARLRKELRLRCKQKRKFRATRCLYVRNCRLRHGRAHDKRADR
ncbi:putative transposase [Shigella flexneri K-1770]|nr:putative transposase [Shigella flexneri K-1770]